MAEVGKVRIHTVRTIKDERPANMPVMRPTELEFVINVQMARMLDYGYPNATIIVDLAATTAEVASPRGIVARGVWIKGGLT